MSAGDLAAVVVVIVSVAAVCALLVTLWALLRVVDQMRRSVDELRDEAMPAVQELRRVVGVVDDDLVRVAGLLDSAEAVADAAESAAETADTMSRLVRVLAIGPFVRIVALGRGVGRGVRRLRRGRRPEVESPPERPRLVA